nr:glycosyltransferase family 2 protein [uncultured Flavobacterium sp.]
MSSSLTAIILTYNEEIHLQRCLDSLKGVVQEIFIIDSYSTDTTPEIAQRNGAQLLQNPWVNYSKQFNWGLDNCPIHTDWILRLDADEYLTPELQIEISNKLHKLDDSISGIEIPLKRIFLNRHMKSGLGEIRMLRIFRKDKARLESRWMDEHIEILEGKTVAFKYSFADHNLNDLGWWTAKHNAYSNREVIDLLDVEFNLLERHSTVKLSEQALHKRKLKLKYVKMPLFLRSFTYFVYRYIFRLGFLDGKEGFLWHFLQGWWYRTLVDAKIYEIKKQCGTDKFKMIQYVKDVYKIDLRVDLK